MQKILIPPYCIFSPKLSTQSRFIFDFSQQTNKVAVDDENDCFVTYFLFFTLTLSSMRTFSNYVVAALMGTALISSCSRPVAYFQPTARQQYKTVPTEAVAVTPAEATQPVAVETSAPQVAVVATPTEQIAQAKQAVSQVEAYVRNDSKLASNKKLAKRMARVSELLTAASDKAAVAD